MALLDLRAELRRLVRSLRIHLEWRQRQGAFAAPAAPIPKVASADAPTTGREVGDEDRVRSAAAKPRLALARVRHELGDCQRCKLSATRNHIVFGVGPEDAPLLFIGEAPGAEEDRRGEPFVGRAGELLDRMISAMGWTRQDVYITNIVKCRPPGNRDPEADEVASCQPFLVCQIEAIRPRVIVTLGRPAAQLLLATKAPISALRGRFTSYRGIPVMPTFHPAYLLRTPERKREAWSDLQQVMAELDRLGIRPPQPPPSC